MALQAIAKEATKGICSFCKGELDKGKMTQHLKFCKQRKEAIVAEARDASGEKTRLFHLVVEGRYNPQYWMHLEVPTSAPLETLDIFLRASWVECCDHLSEFEIAGTHYASEPEDFYFGMPEEEEEVEEAEEVEEVKDEAQLVIQLDALLELVPPEYQERVKVTVLDELRKEWSSVYDLIALIKERLKAIDKNRRKPVDRARIEEERDEYRLRLYQESVLKLLLSMVEDRSLNVQLGNVLKVGQKFSYAYDFGSTTHITLKVVSEREGAVRDEENDVEILARNIPPTIVCQVCGKPATHVASGYYNVEQNGYCDECARKTKGDDYEMLLPVVNSPRIGVCGYTGGQDYEVDWDALEDEDD